MAKDAQPSLRTRRPWAPEMGSSLQVSTITGRLRTVTGHSTCAAVGNRMGGPHRG